MFVSHTWKEQYVYFFFSVLTPHHPTKWVFYVSKVYWWFLIIYHPPYEDCFPTISFSKHFDPAHYKPYGMCCSQKAPLHPRFWVLLLLFHLPYPLPPSLFFSFFSHHCHPGWQLPFLFLPVQLLMSCFLLNVTGVLCWFFVRYKKELSMDSSYVEFAFENQSLRDISGGSVAKTLRSQCRGPGFNPWSGNWIPRATAKDLTCRNKDGRSCMLQLRPSTAKEIKNWWLNWYSVFNDQMTEWMYPLKKKPTDNCNSRKIVTENIHR